MIVTARQIWLTLGVALGLATFPVAPELRARAAEPENGADHEAHQQALSAPRYERSVAAYAVPDITLVDQDDHPVSLTMLLAPGAGVALNFVFTSCNAICPVMTATLSRMRAELGPDATGLRLVSISIDPDHDTPSVLKDYASRFAGSGDWKFLTGDGGQVVRVLKAFDAFTGAKTNHQALTFFRAPGRAEWVRIKGFASAAELASEYRRLREG
jgi:protein SCO1/2